MHPVHLLLALLTMVIWGCNYIVILAGLESIQPLFLCFARLFLTSIPAIFFVAPPKLPFKMIALYGLVMFALQFALLFCGMNAGITPALASLLIQVQPFLTALLAIFFFQEKLTLWQIVGGILSLGGIALAASHLDSTMTLAGVLFIGASALAWAFGNIITKKVGSVNKLALVIWGSLFAWPPLLILSLFLEGTGRELFTSLYQSSWISLGAIAYNTLLSTLFAYGTWSWLLNRYPIKLVAPFTLLVPIVAMISSSLLGETLELWKIATALLVISGVAVNLFGPSLFSKKEQGLQAAERE